MANRGSRTNLWQMLNFVASMNSRFLTNRDGKCVHVAVGISWASYLWASVRCRTSKSCCWAVTGWFHFPRKYITSSDWWSWSVDVATLWSSWRAPWKNWIYWYISFFPPITQVCSVSNGLFTGGRGMSDFSVLKYYQLNLVNILNECLRILIDCSQRSKTYYNVLFGSFNWDCHARHIYRQTFAADENHS